MARETRSVKSSHHSTRSPTAAAPKVRSRHLSTHAKAVSLRGSKQPALRMTNLVKNLSQSAAKRGFRPGSTQWNRYVYGVIDRIRGRH